jgi:hypothetical protein
MLAAGFLNIRFDLPVNDDARLYAEVRLVVSLQQLKSI